MIFTSIFNSTLQLLKFLKRKKNLDCF